MQQHLLDCVRGQILPLSQMHTHALPPSRPVRSSYMHLRVLCVRQQCHVVVSHTPSIRISFSCKVELILHLSLLKLAFCTCTANTFSITFS